MARKNLLQGHRAGSGRSAAPLSRNLRERSVSVAVFARVRSVAFPSPDARMVPGHPVVGAPFGAWPALASTAARRAGPHLRGQRVAAPGGSRSLARLIRDKTSFPTAAPRQAWTDRRFVSAPTPGQTVRPPAFRTHPLAVPCETPSLSAAPAALPILERALARARDDPARAGGSSARPRCGRQPGWGFGSVGSPDQNGAFRRGSPSHGHRGTWRRKTAPPISHMAVVLSRRACHRDDARIAGNDGGLRRRLAGRRPPWHHGPVAACQDDSGMRCGGVRVRSVLHATLADRGLLMMATGNYTDLTLYRRLWRQSRPYRLHIGGLFLLGLLSTPLALLTPLPLKIAVDSVIGSHPLPRFLDALLPAAATYSKTAGLVLVGGLLVAIALLNQLQGFASSLLHTYTGEKLVLSFRAQLFRHVQRLSLSYHDSRGTTDSTYRIQYDAPAIQWITIDGVIPFITAGFTLAGMIYVSARIDSQLALVALVISPFLWLVSRAYSRRLRVQWHEVYRLQSSAMSVVQEALAAVRVVKAFGQEDREQERFIHHASESVWARLRALFTEGGLGLLVGLVTAVGTATVLFIGVRHVVAGSLTLGELLLVMAYLSQLYGPLQTLSLMVPHLQSSLASAERAFSLLDEVPDVTERHNARRISRALGSVAFRNVSFGYDKDHPVLHDVSFEVKPGTRVGIMGTTGAGKTTLMGLLTRFYDPTTGQILLDRVDLRDYKLADLRNQLAIVLQEPVLFSTSIAENISDAPPASNHTDMRLTAP